MGLPAQGGRRSWRVGAAVAAAALGLGAARLGVREPGESDRGLFRRRCVPAERRHAVARSLAAGARSPADRRARHVGYRPARFSRCVLPAGAQRPVGSADRRGDLHDLLDRRVPPRRGRSVHGPALGDRRLRVDRAVGAAHAPRPGHSRGTCSAARQRARARADPHRSLPPAPRPGRELPQSLSADESRRSSRRRRTSSPPTASRSPSSIAGTDAERANPWLLLNRTFDDGAIPAIADATSLQYALHASVGDPFSIDTGADRPLMLRFVGALRDSVLQGEVIVAEPRFTQAFPVAAGLPVLPGRGLVSADERAGHGPRRCVRAGARRSRASTR